MFNKRRSADKLNLYYFNSDNQSDEYEKDFGKDFSEKGQTDTTSKRQSESALHQKNSVAKNNSTTINNSISPKQNEIILDVKIMEDQEDKKSKKEIERENKRRLKEIKKAEKLKEKAQRNKKTSENIRKYDISSDGKRKIMQDDDGVVFSINEEKIAELKNANKRGKRKSKSGLEKNQNNFKNNTKNGEKKANIKARDTKKSNNTNEFTNSMRNSNNIQTGKIPQNNKKEGKKANKNASLKSKNKSIDFEEELYGNSNSSRNLKKAKIKSQSQVQEYMEKKKRRKFIRKIIWGIFKFILIISIIAGLIWGAIEFIFKYPGFNIKEIKINGASKIEEDKIKLDSQISLGENIFKTNLKKTKENIENEPYIANASVKLKIPNKIQIDVIERVERYQIQIDNQYIYIDEYGFILEQNSEKLNLPVILDQNIKIDNIKLGEKLEEKVNDLNVVKKIYEEANRNNIQGLITNIDISDSENYKIYFEEKQKTAYIGDGNNINEKMNWITQILTNEEGNKGEIYVNDLNKQPYFRKQ